LVVGHDADQRLPTNDYRPTTNDYCPLVETDRLRYAFSAVARLILDGGPSDTTNSMHDVAIIGGGPGGLYTALVLARRGFDVAVFEEHGAAGDPVHCTGVLAVDAFDEFDIPRAVILNALETARFFGPSGQSISYTPPQVEAVVVDRRAFDERLCAQATAAGARVHVGAKVTEVDVFDDRVAIGHAGGACASARACVLACGANYTLQRRLGLGMPSVYLQSAQLELPAAAVGDVELHFGSVAPRGFAWVVPVRRGDRTFARIGLMCERDARDHFDRFLARIGPRWGTGADGCLDAGVIPRTKMLPLAPIPKTYGARILAVGDAAGLVKATTGGGIYYSLHSGSLAADVLAAALRAGDLGETALADYERRWRHALGEELDAQLTLRRIADGLSDAAIEDLFELARTDGIMPIVRRTAKFNRHRDLILSLLNHPPARRVLMRRMLGPLSPRRDRTRAGSVHPLEIPTKRGAARN
jgi:digeranylgeranylglycerophospholipid reductase